MRPHPRRSLPLPYPGRILNIFSYWKPFPNFHRCDTALNSLFSNSSYWDLVAIPYGYNHNYFTKQNRSSKICFRFAVWVSKIVTVKKLNSRKVLFALANVLYKSACVPVAWRFASMWFRCLLGQSSMLNKGRESLTPSPQSELAVCVTSGLLCSRNPCGKPPSSFLPPLLSPVPCQVRWADSSVAPFGLENIAHVP